MLCMVWSAITSRVDHGHGLRHVAQRHVDLRGARDTAFLGRVGPHRDPLTQREGRQHHAQLPARLVNRKRDGLEMVELDHDTGRSWGHRIEGEAPRGIGPAWSARPPQLLSRTSAPTIAPPVASTTVPAIRLGPAARSGEPWAPPIRPPARARPRHGAAQRHERTPSARVESEIEFHFHVGSLGHAAGPCQVKLKMNFDFSSMPAGPGGTG